jgi:hypothetical protein
MTSQKKTKKNLGRALAVALAIGSFMGISAAPAVATWDPNNPSWTLDVEVIDSTCIPDYSDPTWMPTEQLFVSGSSTVDMFSPTNVDFEVYLNFSQGIDNNVCGEGDLAPSGDVTASFSGDPALQLQGLDCQTACDATTLYNTMASIQGSVSVVGGTTPGFYSGTLTVVWTPAG